MNMSRHVGHGASSVPLHFGLSMTIIEFWTFSPSE